MDVPFNKNLSKPFDNHSVREIFLMSLYVAGGKTFGMGNMYSIFQADGKAPSDMEERYRS